MNAPRSKDGKSPARAKPDTEAASAADAHAPARSLNQSLDRGLRILEAYTTDKQSLGVRELGRMLDVNAATVYRLVATLTHFGYLQKDSATQKYSLGPTVLSLSAAYVARNSLIELAHQVFARYESRFPYNFYLGVMQEYDAVYVAVKEARSRIKIAVEPGARLSLPSSAIGKVLLASKDDAFVNDLLSKAPPQPLTPLTITSSRELRRQIRDIRRAGYSLNRGEIYSELAAVAAPVHAGGGDVIAALSLTFPLRELETGALELDEIIRLTREAAQELSFLNRSQMERGRAV